FREDLYYRLHVVQLSVPPLRDRPLDIPLMVDHFLAQTCASLGKPLRAIDADALERLVAYRWPGNVRELENVIERAVILSDGESIAIEDLPANVVERSSPAPGQNSFALKPARRALEAEVIRGALRAAGGNRTHAARLLEISHRALLYKLKEYEIS